MAAICMSDEAIALVAAPTLTGPITTASKTSRHREAPERDDDEHARKLAQVGVQWKPVMESCDRRHRTARVQCCECTSP